MKIAHLNKTGGPVPAVPALGLLNHDVAYTGVDPSSLLNAAAPDVLLVDGTSDIAWAKSACELLATLGTSAPVIVVLADGGMVAVAPTWQVRDVLAPTAGPAEIEARLRLAVAESPPDDEPDLITSGALTIDATGYTAKLAGRTLDLTYKEFALLCHLAGHPGRVFTRDQLLREIWGDDYYGGSRTVDVHVRRLRAKLGNEYDDCIATVWGVGYRFSALRQPRHNDPDMRPSNESTDRSPGRRTGRAERDSAQEDHASDDPAISVRPHGRARCLP
ncbi:response regulator transcription factor [Spelaeicoccus albus]|uniref:DNA-binding response OmpR family regulator n=1 Tax=Spelaeicoccus albus TaxID=1280376 RepID=A0A7Z0ABC4_9MICO|nr:response regulator transcription factor [Spelaeicoccus albus]NYI66036.1 DNA-binding response OmpR family regulator [Spelaeicoccus albus]